MSTLPCPICRASTPLKRHCPATNSICDWAVCSRCGVTLDRRRRRGYDRSNRPVVWPVEGG